MALFEGLRTDGIFFPDTNSTSDADRKSDPSSPEEGSSPERSSARLKGSESGELSVESLSPSISEPSVPLA